MLCTSSCSGAISSIFLLPKVLYACWANSLSSLVVTLDCLTVKVKALPFLNFSSLGINQSGYSDQTWQTFVGFAPAFDPKFVILVKLDNPATRSSNESATLVFKEMAKYILDYYQIPPEIDQ